MGAHSTINVTRKTARELYMQHHFPDISDSELESFLEYHLDKYLYNVNIVNDDHDYGEYQLNGDEIARSHLG
jgi:hypothetical protein